MGNCSPAQIISSLTSNTDIVIICSIMKCVVALLAFAAMVAAEADPYYGYYGHGYGHHGYGHRYYGHGYGHHGYYGHHLGKRSAAAEPTAAADADAAPWYGYGYGHGYYGHGY